MRECSRRSAEDGSKHRSLGRNAAVLALLATIAACDAALPAPTYTERDSAGVRIVENVRGAWGEGEAWTVGAEPTLQIGADFLVGVWRDELDVPYVRMYALDRK